MTKELPANDRSKHLAAWLGGVLLLTAIAALGAFFDVQSRLRELLDWIAGLGNWAPVIFILVYAVSCVLFIPASILTFGGGFVFGVIQGSIYVLIGATIGAACAFLLGRHVAQNWVTERMSRNLKFKAIDQAVAKEGWKIVGLARLSPLFPFNVFNYVFAVTQVSFRDFILASAVGVAPATVLYVYVGDLAGDLTQLGTPRAAGTTVEWMLYGFGLFSTVIATAYITRFSRKALDRRLTV